MMMNASSSFTSNELMHSAEAVGIAIAEGALPLPSNCSAATAAGDQQQQQQQQKSVQLPTTEHSMASKWDRLNYLRGKIEGSGAAQRAKHAILEKYAIFCTIDTVDGSTIGSGSALLEPSLSALISRQRKRSLGPREAPPAHVAGLEGAAAGGSLRNSPQKAKNSPQLKSNGAAAAPAPVVAIGPNASPPSATSGLGATSHKSPSSLPQRRTPRTSPSSLTVGSSAFPSAPIEPPTAASPAATREKSPHHQNQQQPPNFNYNYTFFLLPKNIVRKDNIPSKQMMVMPMCPTEVSASAFNSLGFCGKGQCEYGHLLSGTRNSLVNLSDKKVVAGVVGNITVRDGGAVFDLAPSEVSEPTAGFLFACYLLNARRGADFQNLGAVSHDLCPRYKKHQQCDFGPRCLRIHSRKRVADKGPIDAATPLEEILFVGNSTPVPSPNPPEAGGACSGSATCGSPCHQQHASEEELVRMFMQDSGLRTVGDLCRLSEETYGFLIARYEKRPELAPILSRAGALWRCEDRAHPLELAVMCFPNVTRHDAEAIPAALSTVGHLIDAKPKDIAALGLSMGVLEACLQIRARNRDDDGPLYKQIALTDLPRDAFLVRMTEEVCKFRVNAHKSWRKQDATRPIVTSLFTYVDPERCNCRATNGGGASASFAVSSPSDNHAPTATPGGGGSHANRNTAENCSTTEFPWATHWCKCPRSYERAVNYELSTPSGSRCSEQNCLGMLASKMLPTDAIREVFVHGSHHNGEDPNPLFPCGVCENMLRRVGKDIFKKTGGQLLIFMFSAVDSPRKLVWMPVTEISHREGSVFKRFLEEEVRL